MTNLSEKTYFKIFHSHLVFFQVMFRMEEQGCAFDEGTLRIDNVQAALSKSIVSLFHMINLENIERGVHWNLDHYFEFVPQQFVFLFLLSKRNSRFAWGVANEI